MGVNIDAHIVSTAAAVNESTKMLLYIIDLQLTLIAVIVKKMYTKSNSKSIGGALTDLVDYLVDYAAAVFYSYRCV